jgi:hypothetical protein
VPTALCYAPTSLCYDCLEGWIMNLTLHLTPETESRLKEQASLSGRSPEELALEALQEKLADEPTSSPPLSPEEWLRRFDAWVSDHKSRNPRLDDSRDSIYPDRW